MKYNIILWVAFILMISFWLSLSNGESTDKAVNLVEKTVSQYKKDTWFNWSCTIDWEKTSIEGIVLGKIAMDSSYWTKGLGWKHNNRGNLKKAMQRPLPKQTKWYTINKDGWNYYVYPTIEEGLYDITERAKRRGWDKCNISYASTYCYVKGCKNWVKDDAFVWDYYRWMVSVAKAYDAWAWLDIIDNDETRKQSNNITGETPQQSEFRLAKEAEARRDIHLKKAAWEDSEAKKMRSKCVAKKVECLD